MRDIFLRIKSAVAVLITICVNFNLIIGTTGHWMQQPYNYINIGSECFLIWAS